MLLIFLILALVTTGTFAQYPLGSSSPWNQGGPQGPPNRSPVFGKPNRPPPYTRPVQNYGKPQSPGPIPQPTNDDPIPANANLDMSYETQQLPAKLPILAPNGVVEIYNRVVDDLIKRLEISFRKRQIDPMDVVIRPTPTGPVRVPGHLQKRPFRRPGAPLYRSTLPILPLPPIRMKKTRSNTLPRETKSNIGETLPVGNEKPSFRGVGKISKGPLGEENVEVPVSDPDVTPVTIVIIPSSMSTPIENASIIPPLSNVKSVEEPSSEEQNLFRARTSEEYFQDEDELELEEDVKAPEVDTKSRTGVSDKKTKKDSKKDETEEDDEDVGTRTRDEKKDLDSLMQRYQNKNVHENKGKSKYTRNNSKIKEDGASSSGIKKKEEAVKDAEEELVEDEDDDEELQDDLDNIGVGGTGNRPNYFPQGGPLSTPTKPNALLTGLSKIRRASDVAVSVDARSAVITARLLVGPLNININDSAEPMERSVRATIPELEAEIILMERHGVVFLQKFTLDRAYGQDVEISMPKVKSDSKKKGNKKSGAPHGPNGSDPNYPINSNSHQRFQTKMAAHISMEVVKLLRSGNLRLNIMRTAQSSMSKLKLPIKAAKTTKKVKKAEKKRTKE